MQKKKLEVLLCGATDLEKFVWPKFKLLIESMGFEPISFFNSSSNSSNYQTWNENSIKSVMDADIVVYGIVEKYGEITWGTEYINTLNTGKPFILLCDADLVRHYRREFLDPSSKNNKKHKYHQASELLQLLEGQHKTIVSFDSTDFEYVLKREIMSELRLGLFYLQENNKRNPLINKLRSKNYRELFSKEQTPQEIEYLKKTLLDDFENKELRKRVLYYFTLNKILNEQELKDLLESSEQGVARATIDALPQLLGSISTKEEILSYLISKAEEESLDVAIIRRTIVSVLNIDVEKSIVILQKLFPASDIGTPRRILKWLSDNKGSLVPNLAEEKFVNDLNKLVDLSDDFSSKPETLKGMATEIREFIEANKMKKNEM